MAKYESLADIDNVEHARRARAMRFDTLRREWSDNARTVERLEALDGVFQKQKQALERVIDNSNKLPSEVHYQPMRILGDLCLPGGEVKSVLVRIAGSALNGLLSKAAERQGVIDAAAKKRDAAYAALQEEFPDFDKA